MTNTPVHLHLGDGFQRQVGDAVLVGMKVGALQQGRLREGVSHFQIDTHRCMEVAHDLFAVGLKFVLHTFQRYKFFYSGYIQPAARISRLVFSSLYLNLGSRSSNKLFLIPEIGLQILVATPRKGENHHLFRSKSHFLQGCQCVCRFQCGDNSIVAGQFEGCP